ncbi:MAG: hypothetical protein Q4B32_02340 [Clostridia bacterium]|nr:hypothetical protein [Clostridia bacterium]
MNETMLMSRMRSTFHQGAIFLLLLRRFAEVFRLAGAFVLDFADVVFLTGTRESLL